MESKHTTNFNEKPIVFESDTIDTLLLKLSLKVLPGRGSGTVFVTDDDNKLIGIVSDSDLRRFVSRQKRMPTSISEVIKRDFVSMELDDWNKNKLESLEKLFNSSIVTKQWQTFLPIRYLPLTRYGKLDRIIDLQTYQSTISKLKDINVVVGMGYVGLTLALVLAKSGRVVLGIDNNKTLIKNLGQGLTEVAEPGIEGLLRESQKQNLFFLESSSKIIRPLGVRCNFFVCVGTPLNKYETIDLNPLHEVIEEISGILRPGDTVILRSTIPIGTARNLCLKLASLLKMEPGSDFHFVSAPERTVEGDAISELKNLPQIIAGFSQECTLRGEEIFGSVTSNIVTMSSLEASEATKIFSNAYRDYTFAFANYVALISRQFGLDVNEVINSANFGYARANIPKPSPGVGGPCLSKDAYMLDNISQSLLDISPIRTARALNEKMPSEVISFLRHSIMDLDDKVMMTIGLAFKGIPEVRDIRNSSNVEIAKGLSNLCRKQYLIDAVANLSDIDFAEVVQFPSIPEIMPSVFSILNNHPSNVDILNFYLNHVKSEELWIFDPWRLLDTSSILQSEKLRCNLLSLSHKLN